MHANPWFTSSRLLSAAGLLFLSLCGRGQEKPAGVMRDTVPVGRVLRQVVIRGVTLTERDTSAAPVQILRGRDLERVNSLSVADAVRYFSGVQLKDYGGVGGLKTINVRSLGANHTAVFYDGIELGNAQNGQVDLGKFSLDNIEEIALYDGQKSGIFQPANGFASASSLYLTTRQPVFVPGVNTNEKLTIRTGSFGLFNPSLLVEQRISDQLSASLSTELMKANGRYKFRYTNGVYDTTAVRQNGDIDEQRVELAVKGHWKDSSTLSTTVYFYHSARGLPGAIVSNNFTSDQRLWDRDIFVQSHWEKTYSRYRIAASAKFTSDYSRYLNPDFITVDGFLNNWYREHQLYASISQLYRINSWWQVSLANDWQYNTLDDNLYHFPYPTRNSWLNAAATEMHWARLDIQGSLLSTVVDDAVRQYAPAGKKSEVTPSVLLSWQPFADKAFRVRSFFKRIFRMPTFNDLYYTTIGTVTLKPEYANQYDIGLTYAKALGRLVLSVQSDAYFNRVTDKIIAMPTADLAHWAMVNIHKVNVKGWETNVQANWHPADDLMLHYGLSYTYE